MIIILIVCTIIILCNRVTYQVLFQLLVIGDDAIVDDHKLWKKAARVKRLDKGAKGQKLVLVKL